MVGSVNGKYKVKNKDMNRELSQVELQVRELGGLADRVLQTWEQHYVDRCYPDEMFQPKPQKGDLTAHITLLLNTLGFIRSLPEEAQEALIFQVGFAQLNEMHDRTEKKREGSLEKCTENANKLMQIYAGNADVLAHYKKMNPPYPMSVINLAGKEFNNFGAAEGKLLTLGAVKQFRDADILPQMMDDMHEIVYVAVWKYIHEVFVRNMGIYVPFAESVEKSEYSGEEKQEFMKTKPLLSGIKPLFNGAPCDFGSQPRDYVSLNMVSDMDYVNCLREEVTSGMHPALQDARATAVRLTVDRRLDAAVETTRKSMQPSKQMYGREK